MFILEKNGKAVLLESPPMKDNYGELTDYIVGLGHTSIDLIISYHPVGGQFIETGKLNFTNINSMKQAVDNYTTGLGAQSLVGLKDRFGEVFDETVHKPTVMLQEGETEIAGISLEMNQIKWKCDLMKLIGNKEARSLF